MTTDTVIPVSRVVDHFWDEKRKVWVPVDPWLPSITDEELEESDDA